MAGQQPETYAERPAVRSRGRSGHRSCIRRPCPSVRSATSELGPHGRIADHGSPKSHLDPRPRRSTRGYSCSHLPHHFRRSKPVSLDSDTGFGVPERAVPQAVGEGLWASRGPDRVAGRCSDLVLIFTLSRINDCRPGCCVGVCPFGVGVVHGPSVGRAGKSRTHSGRRRCPSRGRCNRWLSHGRARTTSCGRLEDSIDLLVEKVVAAMDAVAVHGEQDRDAVPGPGGDLGGVPPAFSHSDKAA
jgi:hypothetical protein